MNKEATFFFIPNRLDSLWYALYYYLTLFSRFFSVVHVLNLRKRISTLFKRLVLQLYKFLHKSFLIYMCVNSKGGSRFTGICCFTDLLLVSLEWNAVSLCVPLRLTCLAASVEDTSSKRQQLQNAYIPVSHFLSMFRPVQILLPWYIMGFNKSTINFYRCKG